MQENQEPIVYEVDWNFLVDMMVDYLMLSPEEEVYVGATDLFKEVLSGWMDVNPNEGNIVDIWIQLELEARFSKRMAEMYVLH